MRSRSATRAPTTSASRRTSITATLRGGLRLFEFPLDVDTENVFAERTQAALRISAPKALGGER